MKALKLTEFEEQRQQRYYEYLCMKKIKIKKIKKFYDEVKNNSRRNDSLYGGKFVKKIGRKLSKLLKQGERIFGRL